MTFGQRLYELRKEKNISQEELAELLDVSRQSISKWENDKAYPEMTRLLFMSDYFQVSLDYLMRGVENGGDAVPAAYQAKDLLDVWNNFVSNLSPGQRKWLVLFYVLAVCALLAVIVSFIYGAGYVVGQFLGHLMK